MSKALFRWLRGELNGYYLQNIYNTLNTQVAKVRDFFAEFDKQQFNLETMTDETIYNIGKFAGVFLPRLSAGEGYGSLRMTDSEEVYTLEYPDGVERSERGLFKKDTETFEFVHTEDDDYSSDINTLATPTKKSSMIQEGAVPLGYISSEATDVIDENGNVKASKILANPPTGVAYSNFYGNQFMFLSENIAVIQNIEAPIYYELYKVMQWIRYNGANIESFCKLVETVCPDGLVSILAITKASQKPFFIVTYRYNPDIEIDRKNQRLLTLLHVISLKFPQFVMQEA